MDYPTDTYSEEWRHECEARQVLKWGLQERREYLQLVGSKRGIEARLKLEDKVRELWKTR